MSELYYPEGFFVTSLSQDLNATTTTIPLTAVPSTVTKGYMIIEPSSATKREVIHFTSVGVSSVTSADDPTTASDASGRGCIGSITTGGNTTHDQGAVVLIAATEQYWKRFYDALATLIDTSTGLPKSGIVLTLPQINDTSSDHQYIFGVSELAADRTVTLPLLAGNDVFVFADFIQTLTNKRVTKRVTTITSHATPTINTDNCDAVDITAQAEAITSMTTNLTGTPTNFQVLVIRFKDDGTGRAITWGAKFEARGIALPTTTVASKVLTTIFLYDTTTSKWGCVGGVNEV